MIKRKSENVLGESQFGFRRGKEIMDAVRIHSFISNLSDDRSTACHHHQ
jgi:hypothetical protein